MDRTIREYLEPRKLPKGRVRNHKVSKESQRVFEMSNGIFKDESNRMDDDVERSPASVTKFSSRVRGSRVF